jgi:hypothetical protein
VAKFFEKGASPTDSSFHSKQQRYRQKHNPFSTLQTEWQTECKHSIGMLLEKESSSNLPLTEQAKGTGEAQRLSNASN